MPCLTSHLLRNLQYLDLSNNLLTDMTLTETLCGGNSPLKDLRVLNVSGNALQVLPGSGSWSGLWTTLVRSLSFCGPVFVHHQPAAVQVPQVEPPGRQQEHLQLHAPGLLLALQPALPQPVLDQDLVHQPLSACSPGGTRSPPVHVAASVSPPRGPAPQSSLCVQVLDLSNNNLRVFVLVLPALRELHLSGNKFLRLPAGGFFPNLRTLTIQVRASPAPWLLLRSVT